MRANTTPDVKFINELSRRQHIFSSFMESFNTGAMLPPVMVNVYKRIKALETAKKVPEPEHAAESPQDVDTLIETVDEPLLVDHPAKE